MSDQHSFRPREGRPAHGAAKTVTLQRSINWIGPRFLREHRIVRNVVVYPNDHGEIAGAHGLWGNNRFQYIRGESG